MRKRTSSGGSGWTLSSGTRSGSPITTPATVTPLPTSVTSWRGSTQSGSSSPSGTLSAAVFVLRSLTTTPERERYGTCQLTSSSGSPTTSPAWTGRSRKEQPPTGCGITSPSPASSPAQVGSLPRPARQAEGASPRSHRIKLQKTQKTSSTYTRTTPIKEVGECLSTPALRRKTNTSQTTIKSEASGTTLPSKGAKYKCQSSATSRTMSTA